MAYFEVDYSYTHEAAVVVEADTADAAIALVSGAFHPEIKNPQVLAAREYELPEDVKKELAAEQDELKKVLN